MTQTDMSISRYFDMSTYRGYLEWFLQLQYGKSEYQKWIFVFITALVSMYVLNLLRRWHWRRENFPNLSLIGKISRWPTMAGEISRLLIFSTALVFLAILLLEPINKTQDNFPIREPAYAAFGLDDSMSMLARVAPGINKSRLDTAKDHIESLATSFAREGVNDKLLLFTFADEPYQESIDFTNDYERVFLLPLSSVNDFYSRSFGYGTDFAKALEFCGKIFPKTNLKKFCLIFTDGEPEGRDLNDLKMRFDKALSEWRIKHKDIRLYFAVVGDASKAERIYKFDEVGNYTQEFELDDKNQPIETRARPDYMRQAALKAGGGFVHLEHGEELNPILQQVVEKDKKIVGQRKVEKIDDVSEGFLVAYLVILVLILILI